MTTRPTARPGAAPSPAAARVLGLLPAHVVRRDAGTGGLLAALAEAVGSEVEILERDLEALYDGWFVETCPEWVLPYLADLVGVTDLPPVLPGVMSRRAFVANTIGYRRRKGTPAVLEQVAKDASGWPAKVVEEFRRLATTTCLDHLTPGRPAVASLRTGTAAGPDGTSAGRLDLLPVGVAQGALHGVAHTVDVRHIASGRGRYGIPNVAVHLFGLQVQLLGRSPARPPDPGAAAPPAGGPWSVDPFGGRTPLFAAPRPEEDVDRLAAEADLPVPLRPRRLLALLQAARAAGAAVRPDALPLSVWVDGDLLAADRITVAGLEDLGRVPGPLDPAGRVLRPGWQVAVDPVAGLLHPFSGDGGRPATLEVACGYAVVAEIGAGPHDRTTSHGAALLTDAWVGDPTTGPPDVRAQVAVRSGGGDAADPAYGDIAEAAAAASAAPGAAGGSCVVAVTDGAAYQQDPDVTVPASTRLVVVAAAWRGRRTAPGELEPPVVGRYEASGLRPRVEGTLGVTGGAGSSVVIDGLVVTGDVVVRSTGSVTLSSCTVGGRVRVLDGSDGLVLRVLRSRCAGVSSGPDTVTVEVEESTVDAAPPPGGAPAAPVLPAIEGPRLALTVSGSTVVGGVVVRTLSGTNAILDGRVLVEDRQQGCLRHCFVERGSRAPRRYRCSPSAGAADWVRPVYADRDRGSPGYLALAPGCPAEIAEGGEAGAEMGVHHHLGRPVRVRATRRLLDPYLPVAPEAGLRSSVPVRPPP